MTRFPMLISILGKGPMLVIGATRESSYVEVNSEGYVRVKMGLFEETFEPGEVTGAAPMEWPMLYGIGARMTEDVVAYVSSTDNVVCFNLRAKRAFTLVPGLTIERDKVCVSVEDVNGFIEALSSLGG